MTEHKKNVYNKTKGKDIRKHKLYFIHTFANDFIIGGSLHEGTHILTS